MLYNREIPEVGGGTLYANMCRAYEALPPALKREVEGRRATHDATMLLERQARRRVIRLNTTTQELSILANTENPAHPLVVVHPETGRKCLFLNEGFTTRIVGMRQDESDALLEEPFEFTVHSEFVYRQKWHAHDICLRNNRCTQHSATGSRHQCGV